MTDIKVVVPKKMQPVVDRYNKLVKRANEGDRNAEKILRHGERYGMGPRKMSNKL